MRTPSWSSFILPLIVLALQIKGNVLHRSNMNRIEILTSFQRASNGFDMRGVVESDLASASAYLDGPCLTIDAAFWIGVGFGEYLRKINPIDCGSLTVGIGRDSRESGAKLTLWLAGGLEAAGVNACDLGLSTTPAMYLSCVSNTTDTVSNSEDPTWPFAGAISLTASHLPSHWNGFKFFTPDMPSNIGEEGIRAIIESCALQKFDSLIPFPSDFQGREPRSFLPTYSEFLKKTVRDLVSDGIKTESFENSVDVADYLQSPLRGLKICVNAGNGAGGFLSSTLQDLGADTSSSLHLEPDGSFPNHIANPEDRKAIQCTADTVSKAGADLGICLDTDADRVGLVEGNTDIFESNSGDFLPEVRLLNRNCLIAMVSKVALRGLVGGVIVTDSATSNGLTRFIETSLGGKHLRYKKGYRFVIEKARGIKDCVAAVECSGHGAWRDNGWVDDGCYTAVKLLAELSLMRRKQTKTLSTLDLSHGSESLESVRGSRLCRLSDLLEGLEEPAESVELRFKITGGPSKTDEVTRISLETLQLVALSALCNHIDDGESTYSWSIEEINYEGLRVNFDFTVREIEKSLDDATKSSPSSRAERKFTGWCMLRASLHEPILSMQMECDQMGGLAIAAHILLHGTCLPVDSSTFESNENKGTSLGFSALKDLMDITPLERLSCIPE